MSFPSSTSSGDLIADRRFNHAAALAGAGDLTAACEVLEQALERTAEWAEGWLTLGDWRARLGRREAAAAAYTTAANLDSTGRLGAGLRLAALGAAPLPHAMAASYVQALFDDYAPRFEESLLGRLAYDAPARLMVALGRFGDRRFARVLDLGCGTGLMGVAVCGRADRLAGVDLSEKMLKVAAAKGVYDRLAVGDAGALLAAEPGASLELVVAADMVPYVGALSPLFAAVARSLSPGGVFAFSCERHDGQGFVLGEALRFRHSAPFIRAAAEAAGLTLLALDPASMRREKGLPVAGLIGLLVRPSAA